jgi:hypothetical protein
MATTRAVRCNPVLKCCTKRLLGMGKHRKVPVACMRKLLRICNAVIAHQLAWTTLPASHRRQLLKPYN